ncbi:MAG: hypothetical protein SGJ00_08710 [bacterium]|nr:hypothetical protein [bacterium]
MKIKVLLMLLLFAFKGYACKCGWTTIAENYQSSSLIFYGKHLGTINSKDVFGYNGKPLVTERFEVMRFYKGGSNEAILPQQNIQAKPFYLTILSNCKETSCGFCFDSNSYYLVYASVAKGREMAAVGFCSRTKKIIQHQFIIPSQPDPEAGRDESKELIHLAQTDTFSSNEPTAQEDWMVANQSQEQSKIELQKQLKKKGSMTIILSTTTLILLIYLAFDWFKKKKY